jgi:hypothetical protein
MKIELPKLTKTQKIIAAFAIVVAITFLACGCGTSTTSEVKTDSTEMKLDSVTIDTLK